jgi:hypothetical protein
MVCDRPLAIGTPIGPHLERTRHLSVRAWQTTGKPGSKPRISSKPKAWRES